MTNHYDKTRATSVKGHRAPPWIVAVIASIDDLHRAIRLRRSPDLFELRLDALAQHLSQLDEALDRLGAPLIITARHPAEGGVSKLSAAGRQKLLRRFLDRAAFVDMELRSAVQLRAVLDQAARMKIKRIISVHDLRRTPTLPRLLEYARAAETLSADVFKLATRTDTISDVECLTEFMSQVTPRISVSVMGIGELGRYSRMLFARGGSVLNYAHLGVAGVEGQLRLRELRRLQGRTPITAKPSPRLAGAYIV